MNERKMLFFVAIVPEGDDLEAAEARGQMSHRFDSDAHAVGTEPFAIMVFVASYQRLEVGNRREAREAGNPGAAVHHRPLS
jgi:VanZ family protein